MDVLATRYRRYKLREDGRQVQKRPSESFNCRLGCNESMNRSYSSTVLSTTTAGRLALALSLRDSSLLLPKGQLTDTIHQRAALLHATGHTAITRRYIQAGIAGEEVARPQQQAHRLGRHNREILGAGEVGQTKSVPEDDVGVFQVRGGVGCDPGWDALGGVA